MSIGGLLISFALTLAAAALTAYPLLRSSGQNRSRSGVQEQAERVQTYYERVLTNIRDLDEDFSTGKIREADYREEREVWVHRGIRLLRVQDQLAADDEERIDRAIEDAIRTWRHREEAESSC